MARTNARARMAREQGSATRQKDLIPLTVDAPICTIKEDRVHIAPLAAVWEGRDLVVTVTVTLPAHGKHQPDPKTRTLRLTNPDERRALAAEIFPRAAERTITKLLARLEAGVDTVNLALLETRRRPAPAAGGLPYRVEGHRFWYHGPGGWQPLCNFEATIKEEVIRDDGAEERGELRIVGKLDSGESLEAARMELSRFAAMNWPVSAWGTRAVPGAGMGTKDRIREAIQLLSPKVERRRVYAHTGFRSIDGRPVFLHAGGAIGADGPVTTVEVELDEELRPAVLPNPSDPDALRAAVQASLALRELGPATVTVPTIGATYRAPLCAIEPADLTLQLVGPSGVFKTELTTLAQAHWGTFTRLTLPGAWSSTGNSLERLAFVAKDVLLVVDDFAPSGSPHEVARYHANAERFLRAVGNQAGRGRLGADGKPRPRYRPRGMALSSGEEVPGGHSVRARQLLVDVAPGDVASHSLDLAQQEAARGTYALAMAGYVQWLCARFEALRMELPERFRTLRAQWSTNGDVLHTRLPAAQAHLLLGWEVWLDFAVDCGATTRAQADDTLVCVRAALSELAQRTQQHVADQEAAGRFMRLLGECLSTGKAHLLARNGGTPPGAERWGWRPRMVGDTEVLAPATAQHIGWLDGPDIYLAPEATYAAVQRLAHDQGHGGLPEQTTLWKRLRTKGLLASWDEERQRLVVRKTCQGARQYVLHLHISTMGVGTTQPAQPAQSDQSGPQRAEITREEQATGDSGAGETGPQNRPKTGPDRPKTGPTAPQPGANGYQNTPESAQNSPQSAQNTSESSATSPVFEPNGTGCTQNGPVSRAGSGPTDPTTGPIFSPLDGAATRENPPDGPIGPIGPVSS